VQLRAAAEPSKTGQTEAVSTPVTIESAATAKNRWLVIEEPQRVWRFERAFLISTWSCIYGSGCRGIHPTQDPARMDGCCTYGAHFAEAEDFMKVLQFVPTLTPDVWQHHAYAARKGWFKRLPNGRIATRTTGGACVFSNRDGFAGGVGCALHIAALQQGRRPVEVKPDVCWELPIHTTDSEAEDGRRVITVRRWDRADFGPEGNDMKWWCTDSESAPEAFAATNKLVYETLIEELTELCGSDVYAQIVLAMNR
jgi:hypothetical protein